MKRLLFLLMVCMTVTMVWGFLPPRDTKNGITLEIKGVPEKAVLAEGVSFQVVATNQTQSQMDVILSCFMNDDWKVQPLQSIVRQTVPAGGTVSWFYLGTALERAESAWYPVHAIGKVIPADGGEAFELHPIALFQTKRTQAAETREIVGGADQTAHRATAPIVFDGVLDEWWEQALPVNCGVKQSSAGTVNPQSFDGLVMFLHDDTYLYIGGQISDDDISCQDVTSPDYMNSDYLRLYFNGIDPAGRQDDTFTAADIIAAVNLFGGPDGTTLVKVPSYAAEGAKLQGFEVLTRRNGVGYTFECRLPKSAVKAETVMGMNLMIGDADKGVRRSEICLGKQVQSYWLTPKGYFRLHLAGPLNNAVVQNFELEPVVMGKQALKLHKVASRKVSYKLDGEPSEVILPRGFNGGDKTSGVTAHNEIITRKNGMRESIAFHPPWRIKAGDVRMQFRIELPAKRETEFISAIAIRNSNPETEKPSDGVEFIVEVNDGTGAKRLFDKFTDTKEWLSIEVSLKEYAGKTIDLSLIASPGPKRDTNCDSCYFGEPTIRVKSAIAPETAEELAERRRQAAANAKLACTGHDGMGAFVLEQPNGTRYGAGIVPGKEGMADAIIVFTDGSKSLEYRGIDMSVANLQLGAYRNGEPLVYQGISKTVAGTLYHHAVETEYGEVPVEVLVSTKGGVLLMTFTMPGVQRDLRGQPRYTAVSLGRGSERPWRLYAGFGNVLEDPKDTWSIGKGGFTLSTRHVGVDFKNGMSLAMASDFFPDRVICQPDENIFTLVAHNDVTLYFAPSNAGAFAAAHEYGRIVGFQASPGLPELLGRQCLDQWGGDYAQGVTGARLAARYGLNHSIFVKHVWQRWGYDYRLPEVYPPAGDADAFVDLCKACQDNGIIFAPHDNYIDFYPDAEGFSYDHIIYNADRTPQLAWYNNGRAAQSYRWLPHAFRPWLLKNMQLIHDNIGAHGLFIDVFTARAPADYYDRSGRFYDSKKNAREWAAAFDTCRDILWKDKAPMLSECGHDGLIGSLDGGQADHWVASRWGFKGNAERVPWHDCVTHGKMVLLGGGLAGRYADKDVPNSGYASDNYINNTLIGGRNPMSSGPFSRDAVQTYWMIHDVSDWLAHQTFDRHEFGPTIHQQHTVFGGGAGQVWTNRGEEPWTLPNGMVLPSYGYYAEVPGMVAAVIEKDGKKQGFARKDGCLYYDSRPQFTTLTMKDSITVKVLALTKHTEAHYTMELEWILPVVLKGDKPAHFIHICHPEANQGEHIAFQGHVESTDLDIYKAGIYHSTVSFDIPENQADGTLQVLFGLFEPKTGGRFNVVGKRMEGTRVFGGEIEAKHIDGKLQSAIVVQQKENSGTSQDQPLLAFDDVRTNGAFRLMRQDNGSWQLIPVPGSLPFKAEIPVAKLFGKATGTVQVHKVEPLHESATEPRMTQDGGIIRLEVDGRSFAYQLDWQE